MRQRDYQCTTLNKIKGYQTRDLYASHANRLGISRDEVIENTFHKSTELYHPHPFKTEPIKTPPIEYQQDLSREEGKMKSARLHLLWMRRVSRRLSHATRIPREPASFDRVNAQVFKDPAADPNKEKSEMHRILDTIIGDALKYRSKLEKIDEERLLPL